MRAYLVTMGVAAKLTGTIFSLAEQSKLAVAVVTF